MKIRELLQEMVDQNASDIFIVAGLPLTYQVEGRQVRWDAPLMPADTSEVVHAIYGLAGRDINPFLNSFNHDDDYSFAVPGLGRFRVNVFRQRGSLSAIIRIIPFTLPTAEQYHIPEEVMACAEFEKGLVLVTGPAGAGKSTTLACMIDRLNHERSGHIITMEDPIEFVHRHDKCIVTQREIPTDVATYSEALRSAMRESPDIVLLGVSRSSKTPISIYMGMEGYKVANVPLALGTEPPKEIYDCDPSRIFGLMTTPDVLVGIRQRRLGGSGRIASMVAASYAEPEMVYQDLEEARALMRKLGCIVIRTDNKAVEETAQEILRYFELAHPLQKSAIE